MYLFRQPAVPSLAGPASRCRGLPVAVRSRPGLSGARARCQSRASLVHPTGWGAGPQPTVSERASFPPSGRARIRARLTPAGRLSTTIPESADQSSDQGQCFAPNRLHRRPGRRRVRAAPRLPSRGRTRGRTRPGRRRAGGGDGYFGCILDQVAVHALVLLSLLDTFSLLGRVLCESASLI